MVVDDEIADDVRGRALTMDVGDNVLCHLPVTMGRKVVRNASVMQIAEKDRQPRGRPAQSPRPYPGRGLILLSPDKDAGAAT